MKPSGARSYILQYRNRSTGASKRLTVVLIAVDFARGPAPFAQPPTDKIAGWGQEGDRRGFGGSYGDVSEIAEIAMLEDKGALIAVVPPERYCSFQKSDVSVLRTPRHRAPPQKQETVMPSLRIEMVQPVRRADGWRRAEGKSWA
jgi:hypothetical protein